MKNIIIFGSFISEPSDNEKLALSCIFDRLIDEGYKISYEGGYNSLRQHITACIGKHFVSNVSTPDICFIIGGEESSLHPMLKQEQMEKVPRLGFPQYGGVGSEIYHFNKPCYLDTYQIEAYKALESQDYKIDDVAYKAGEKILILIKAILAPVKTE